MRHWSRKTHEFLAGCVAAVILGGTWGVLLLVSWWFGLGALALVWFFLWHQATFLEGSGMCSCGETTQGDAQAREDVWREERWCRQRPSLDEATIPDSTAGTDADWERQMQAFLADVHRHQRGRTDA